MIPSPLKLMQEEVMANKYNKFISIQEDENLFLETCLINVMETRIKQLL